MPKIAIQIEPMWGFEFHEIRAIADSSPDDYFASLPAS